MQRFLLFILIVIFCCLALVKIFIDGLEPVNFTAALDVSSLVFNPVFDHGHLIMDITWNKVQMVYLCKIIILLIIVIVAVYNYKVFINEPEDAQQNQ